MIRALVPCDGCTACCRTEAVLLVKEDDASQYQVMASPGGTGLMLRRKPDGSCIYLDGGCTIWERAPTLCKVYDCRRQYAMHTRSERRKMISQGLFSKEVMEAARKRVHTLGG